MSTLDIRTLFVASMMVSLMLGVVMVAYWRLQKTHPGFDLWTISNAIVALVFVLFALRGAIPALLSVIVANDLAILAAALRWEGASRFTGSPRSRYRWLLVPLIALAVLSLFMYGYDSTLIRGVVTSATIGFMAWGTARALSGGAVRRPRGPDRAVAILFAIRGALMVARIVVWLMAPHEVDLLAATAANAGFFLISMLLEIAITAGFLTLSSERLMSDLEAAQANEEASRRRLADIIAFLPDATFVVDRDGTVIAWNRTMEALTGVAAASVVGKGNYAYGLAVFGERRPMLVDVVLNPASPIPPGLDSLVQDNQAITAETPSIVVHGKPVSLWAKAALLFDADGKPAGAIESIRDVTDRKRLEGALRAGEKQYHDLFDLMLEGLAVHEILCDDDGRPVNYRYLSANAAFESLTGLRVRDILGKTVLEIMPDLEPRWIERYGHVALTGESIQFEDYSTALERYYEIRAFSPERGKFATLFADITERKKAEQSLRAGSDRLERMVETRTRELADAQEKLVRQDKLAALGRLAGGVGHELRSPLGVISSAVYYLKMVQPDADPQVRDYLALIDEEVRRAAKIIGDLLDFGRVRPPVRNQVALADLVDDVLAHHVPPEGVAVELALPPDTPPLFVDADQITQVLANLVTNAYQAMPTGGRLTLTARQEDRLCSLAVSDTGTGIPPENMDKLFEPLFTTKAAGVGLGLAVSKGLAEANGGRIEVHSEPGHGATFTLYLPSPA